MTYKEEIKKLIFEKIMLGTIVGAAIYFGSINMEEIKANENFKSELNKIRISKIAEVWEKANKFEADFYKLYHAIEKEKILMKFYENNLTKRVIFEEKILTPYMEILDKSRVILMQTIHKNSFYLGENLEKQVIEFYRALAIINIYQKINLDKERLDINGSISIKKAKIEVDRFRANISQIRNHIINAD